VAVLRAREATIKAFQGTDKGTDNATKYLLIESSILKEV